MDLKEEQILGADVGHHWYYASKSLALRTLIGPYSPWSEVLDVGAGSGFFARELITHHLSEVVTCIDPGYSVERDEVLDGGLVQFRRSVTSSNASVALFMDVLEHVDDDRGLLRNYGQILGPGKLIVITVPAFQFLWSGHDEFLEHKRRYTIRSLEAAMQASGLAVLRSHYFFGAVFPVAAAVRVKGRLAKDPQVRSSLRQQGRSTNQILARMGRAESRVQRFNRVAGLSVFGLGITLA